MQLIDGKAIADIVKAEIAETVKKKKRTRFKSASFSCNFSRP